MVPVDPTPFLFYVSEETKKTTFKPTGLKKVYSGTSVEKAIERIIENSESQGSISALTHCFYISRDNSISGHMAGNAKMLVKDLQQRLKVLPANSKDGR